ncbi:hypothetical protein PR048_000030 [Dryococelus australis]|uniref:General transcription factor IIH subunit 3 n=1 Tax=Dryococelus australis TaxID=614101 RepID=A0ABQ9IDH5_9NEOP|nr:hypothetical protein PR048_000030 [Dryococelus australis]
MPITSRRLCNMPMYYLRGSPLLQLCMLGLLKVVYRLSSVLRGKLTWRTCRKIKQCSAFFRFTHNTTFFNKALSSQNAMVATAIITGFVLRTVLLCIAILFNNLMPRARRSEFKNKPKRTLKYLEAEIIDISNFETPYIGIRGSKPQPAAGLPLCLGAACAGYGRVNFDVGLQGDSLCLGSLPIYLAENILVHTVAHMLERELSSGFKMNSRVLVITGSSDSASQYMNYMNVFFTAQKQNVMIDVCSLDQELGLLQQGCDITGGLYLQVPQLQGLVQYLLWVFLPEPPIRRKLVLPPPVKVDYRAACFCHRELVDIGFVCSVCLSIFCKFSPICTTCQTFFT